MRTVHLGTRKADDNMDNSEVTEQARTALNPLKYGHMIQYKDMICIGEGDLGTGVFARRKINKGEPILEFTGPIISFAEAVLKGEKECYPLQIGKDRYIDLMAPGCYANHSCQPNAGIVNDTILVAIRDILPGEEVRYDYSTTMDEDHFTMVCRCGSSQCRGVVTDFKKIPLLRQREYLGMKVVMSFIADQLSQEEDCSQSRSGPAYAVSGSASHPRK